MENNIPTAEEMEQSGKYDDYNSMMRAFAKLHVQAALKAASKVELDDASLMPEANDFEESRELSILNAYPLENIK